MRAVREGGPGPKSRGRRIEMNLNEQWEGKTVAQLCDLAYELWEDGECHAAMETVQKAFSIARTDEEVELVQSVNDELIASA